MNFQRVLPVFVIALAAMYASLSAHHSPVAYAEIPRLLINAVVAAEDDRFFEHPGVDYQGVIRAFLNEVMSGDRGVGGSTITQQVARTTNLGTRERRNAVEAYVRKFKEWILALRIEREFTKPRPLYEWSLRLRKP